MQIIFAVEGHRVPKRQDWCQLKNALSSFMCLLVMESFLNVSLLASAHHSKQ